MKNVISILIILLLSPFIGIGQQNLPDLDTSIKFQYPIVKPLIDTGYSHIIGDTTGLLYLDLPTRDTGFVLTFPKPDTIPCIMLVSDTSSKEFPTYGTLDTISPFYLLSVLNKSVWWIKGYYIRGYNWNAWNNLPVYLDENKIPLPNNIIVWMSQGEKQ